MKKAKGQSISIIVLAVLMILICLSLPLFKTSAWFTSGDNQQIQIVIKISNINLSVYQKFSTSTGDGTLIQTYDENEEATNKSYVDLTNGDGTTREILPDNDYALTLTLKNEDKGTSSMYVRYKVELLINGTDADISLNLSISGQSAPTSTTAGFVKNADGYYYYKDSAENNLTYPSNTNLAMMTSFSIPYSEFIKTSNNINADTVKLVVTIEGFDVDPG